ncbi:glutamate--cysteine ligase [Halobacteriovorax marinus]|uniref:Glutamate--cysteine ligase n=1 Tax=Halobacteriovorax marinus TaxID=97084 RepID=A0A1Y5F5G2_9BACT|nr:glutamate--cysteine ligase [Halobacteriovorax marinus]
MTYQINSKNDFENFVTENWNSINKYIDSKFEKDFTPIYSSVDIRESKTKIAPVDHNMYPAGFNNLCALDLDYATEVFESTLKEISPEAKTIGIIPESHTKNLFYLDNLAMLGKLIRDAGFEVLFLSFDNNLFENNETLNLISHSKFDIEIAKAKIEDGRIHAHNELIDLVVLNNDQSDPIDIDWDGVHTPVTPVPHIGWFARQKNKHFSFYNEVVQSFAEEFSINPDLLQAKFTAVEDVDFSSKQGLERLGKAVDDLKVQLPEDKKIFVKASKGTYGMGISVVSSGEEIITMNRKARNKMDVGKNKIKFTSLLIQEGVETILQYDDMPAEVAIYLINGKSVGGFMRANSEKDADGNLNSRGMVFRKFCISEIRQNQDHKAKECMYTVVARLATLASTLEIKEVLK